MLSNYSEAAILNHFFRGVATSAPAAVYAALIDEASDVEAGTVTEAEGATRQQVTFAAPVAGEPTTITNSNTLDYGDIEPTTNYDVEHVALYDAASGGNYLGYATLTTPVDIQSGVVDTATIPAGSLVLSLS